MKKASKMSGLASAFVIPLLLMLSLGANDLALAANPGIAGGAPMSNSAKGPLRSFTGQTQ